MQPHLPASAPPERAAGPAGSDAPLASVPLAPRWHTAVLLVGMLGLAVLGAIVGASKGGALTAPPPEMTPLFRVLAVYVPMIVVQLGMVLYVVRIGRPTSAFSVLLGRRWDSARRAAEDLALAGLGWLFVMGGETAWARLAGSVTSSQATGRDAVSAVMPHTMFERAGWIAVALSVGLAEELVYRGYLQTQLGAFTKNVAAGIVLAAALFGIVHGEQGLAVAFRFSIYGAAFGLLAHYRKSLLPGILCHAFIDAVSGIARGALRCEP